jgi:hypothetical protein
MSLLAILPSWWPGALARLLFLLAPISLSAQGVVVPEGESSLRGDLVRFPDARVEVSIFAETSGDIPESLWERIRVAGTVSFLAAGSPEVNDAAWNRLRGTVGVDNVLIVSDPSALTPLGVEVDGQDGIRLVWRRLAEEEGVAILADARAADEAFALRILIPDPTIESEDWWGLQAALSRVGIRRVHILSGSP